MVGDAFKNFKTTRPPLRPLSKLEVERQRLHERKSYQHHSLASQASGRGAASNESGRFERFSKEVFDDGWEGLEDLPAFQTEVREERAKTIIATNSSPDIPFSHSINPYRGCEHGCAYCFARPTHTYWGFSAGLDFETRLTAKINAVELLEKELAKPSYKVSPIALGINTDAYQPIEKKYQLTRSILKVLARAQHPVTIVTKSAMVLRDLDILSEMAEKNLVSVAFSVTTLDNKLSRAMEPRASAPHRRLFALKTLAKGGVPTMVLAAPMIPSLNDHELEGILKAAADAGVVDAGYILVRLPHEISPLFQDWLARHYPERAERVMSLIRSMRGGKDYEAVFGKRLYGEGPYAELMARRFRLAVQRFGFNKDRSCLATDIFEAPVPKGAQMSLF